MSGLDWLYWGLVVGLFLALIWRILAEPAVDEGQVSANDTEVIPITEAAMAEAATRVWPRAARQREDGWHDKLDDLLAEWSGPAVTAHDELLLEVDATNRLLRRAALLLDG